MLTAFFELCNMDDYAQQLLNPDLPSHYTWKEVEQKKGDVIRYVNSVNPNQGESFYEQPLLHRVAGPIFCEHLKHVDGLC